MLCCSVCSKYLANHYQISCMDLQWQFSEDILKWCLVFMAEKLCSTEAVLTGRQGRITVLGENIKRLKSVVMTTPVLYLLQVHSTLIMYLVENLVGRVGVSLIGYG